MKQKLEQVNRRCRTMTEKGREYKISILDKKKSSLVSSIIRKSSEIDDLMYSYENATTVKEELAQLDDIYKLIVEINDEMTEIDVNYSEELWFAKIDEKVFSFKHKIHNWLREERMVSKEKGLPNLQVPDQNHQVRVGQQDLDHQGCHPKRKLYRKS